MSSVALDHRDDDSDDDVLVDGHGDRTYAVPEGVVALHRAAVAAGWEHKNHPTSPYENLAALLATVEVVDGVDPDRDTVEAFAYRYICGYGPHSTPGALDALAADPEVDATVPGGGDR
jgi:hypothetical protein